MQDGINRHRIKNLMTEKSFTEREMAIRTGFTEATINGFLRGRNPSYKLMKAIQKALELDATAATDIFFGSNLPNK